MSIHQINKLFQNKGCNFAMSLVLLASVATLIGGVGFRGCAKQQGQGDQSEGGNSAAPPIATVGDFSVTKEQVQDAANKQLAQLQGADVPTEFKLRFEGSALGQQIDQGLALVYAKSQGVDFSDNLVKQRILAAETESIKQDLVGRGKLTPNATQQELENTFKAEYGKSFLDALKDADKQIEDHLKTADGKALADASVAAIFLVDKLKSKFVPTEDTIKADFNTYHFKMIAFSDPKVKDPLAKAQQALKEIKGGLSFEAAMDKYSTTPAEKGKKKSDATTDIFKTNLDRDPSTKPLLGLKPGQVSNVIASPAGPAIYKLINSGIQLPKDFATQKAALIDEKAKSDAGKSIMEQIKKLETASNIKWQSEGFHVLYDYFKLSQAPSSADHKKLVTDIVNRALSAQGDLLGAQEAVGTALMALPEATVGMPAPQATDLKITVLSAYVQQYPEAAAKTQLAEAYMDKGSAKDTATALHDAADQNSAQTDAVAKGNWERLNKDIKTAEAKKLLQPDEVKALSDMYSSWLKDYAAAVAAAKQEAEDQKKAQEAIDKANKTPPTPAPTPGTTPKNQPPGKGQPPAQKGTTSILHPSNTGSTGK